jgi:hypothetical protein
MFDLCCTLKDILASLRDGTIVQEQLVDFKKIHCGLRRLLLLSSDIFIVCDIKDSSLLADLAALDSDNTKPVN